MKGFPCVAVLVIVLLLVPEVISVRHIGRPRSRHGHAHSTQPKTKDGMMAKADFNRERRPTMRKGGDTLAIAGSSLPDCSHACGSCSPCRLVMVSFVCSSLEEAETCPMAYKCMCHNKSYPVP
ncbi:EPIDERMAL PATTERNING FACTOR-like protein 5 [Fagus crenata]|uniref:Epidermal patterning factor-like protein n=1 Tax=Fagus sylvatica TaxID=28930 RepID=A0A2N9EWF8_FAGSY